MTRLLRALLVWQTKRPGALLAIALVTVLVSAALAARLQLKTAFGELLPRGKRSVIVADDVEKRIVSASTLILVAEGEDKKALERFVDELAPRVRALGPELVGNVDDGVKASRAFFGEHALLYASLDDLEKASGEIDQRFEYAVAKKAGTLIDDDEPPPLTAKAIREQLAPKGDAPKDDQFPDGYYLEKSGKLICLLIRTPVASGDLERSKEFRAKIDEVVRAVDPARFDPKMRIAYTGDFVTSQEVYDRIKGDLSHVGLAGVLMILAVVFLFFLRLRTLLVMALTIAIGVAWTFGFAYLSIGHLNSSTGFLVSIVVGNGINFGIIYMARYLEARRSQSVDESLAVAMDETWVSTLAAAGAALVAYGSLVVTDFRGFKHFGLIGGAGMILCWIATYAFLPAILAVSERFFPLHDESPFVRRFRGAYARPFARVALGFPRAVTLIGLALGVVTTALTVRYVLHDPMEYDMWNVRTEEPEVASTASSLASRVDPIIGRQGQEGVAILVDRLEQVRPLQRALDARRDAAPADAKPFDRVVTIFDLIPSEQEKKIAVAEHAASRLRRARELGIVADEEWKEIEPLLPKGKLTPIGVQDLPEQVARAFIEKDGTRGRLVYIVPATGRSVWDARYLIQWADAFRRTELPDGSVVEGSGRSVIFADMILTVIEDAPKAIVVSVLGTLAVLALAFRGRRATLGAFAALGLGMTGMIATMALYHAKLDHGHLEISGMKLNFLNFVAIPISIGVGSDYAVNILARAKIAGPQALERVAIETGGAVILCSLTTTLGYLALTLSANLAIVSFGVAAAAGEICAVLAAVLVLPAALAWRRRRDLARTEPRG